MNKYHSAGVAAMTSLSIRGNIIADFVVVYTVVCVHHCMEEVGASATIVFEDCLPQMTLLTYTEILPKFHFLSIKQTVNTHHPCNLP
jgi:hypothetical protein